MSIMSFPFANGFILPYKATHVLSFTGISLLQDKGAENKKSSPQCIKSKPQDMQVDVAAQYLWCLSAIALVVSIKAPLFATLEPLSAAVAVSSQHLCSSGFPLCSHAVFLVLLVP